MLLLLIMLTAFALLMGLNLYILLYQQQAMGLLVHLRGLYPEAHQAVKGMLQFSLFRSQHYLYRRLEAAFDGVLPKDGVIEGRLEEMAILRARGWRVFAVIAIVLLILVGLWLGFG